MAYTLITSVDDCIIRNPQQSDWGYGVENTLDTLARHAVFGHPILIDSPFFIHNQILRKMITDQGENILKLMIKYHRVLIITETGNIVADQEAKAGRGENMANTIKSWLDALYVEFQPVENWLSSLSGRSPYIKMPRAENYIAERMRKSLINDLIHVRHPMDMHFTMAEKKYDAFRRALTVNLQHKTPRSSCELSFDSNDQSYDNVNARQEIMSYAHEAFYLSMAAYLTEYHKMDIILETAYSPRFDEKLPYSKMNISGSSEIRLSLRPLLHNRASIIDKLFEKTNLAQSREDYINDPNSIIKASLYEKKLNEAIAPLNLSIFAQISVGTGIAVTPTLAQMLLQKRKMVTKRELGEMTMAAIGLTLGAKLLSNVGATSAGSLVNNCIIDDIEEISDKEALTIDLANRVHTAPVSQFVASFTQNMHSAAMTKLKIDVNSNKYLRWKNAVIT